MTCYLKTTLKDLIIKSRDYVNVFKRNKNMKNLSQLFRSLIETTYLGML